MDDSALFFALVVIPSALLTVGLTALCQLRPTIRVRPGALWAWRTAAGLGCAGLIMLIALSMMGDNIRALFDYAHEFVPHEFVPADLLDEDPSASPAGSEQTLERLRALRMEVSKGAKRVIESPSLHRRQQLKRRSTRSAKPESGHPPADASPVDRPVEYGPSCNRQPRERPERPGATPHEGREA